MQLLGIVAPLVMEGFDVDRSVFGFAMGAALVGFGLGGWGGGWLGDRIGRRMTLPIAAAIFSLATIGAGVSNDIWQLAGWRLLGGIGFGAAYANSLALASEWAPDRLRPVIVSTLSVGVPIGGAIVGWIGPELAAASGWQGAFTMLGTVTLAMVIITYLALRDSPAFLLARGKTEAAHKSLRLMSSEPIELEQENAGDGQEEARASSIMQSSFLRLNVGIAIAFAASTLCAYGILSWTTTFLTAAGWSLENAGTAISVAGITSMLGTIFAGIAIRQFGSRAITLFLSVTMFVLMVALGLAVENYSEQSALTGYAMVIVLIGAAAATFSGAIGGMYVIMTHAYPPACRSAGIGFGVFMSCIGAVAASGFGGVLLDLGAGDSVIPFFAVMALAGACISAATFIVDRHVPPLAKIR